MQSYHCFKKTHLTRCFPASLQQRGDMIIEAMIAMVLMATLAMGAAFMTSKVSSSQRDMRLQEIAVNKMRTALLQHRMGITDVCANFSITLPTDEDVEIAKLGCNGNVPATMTATVNGQAIADFPQPIFLAARSESLGTIVVGGTWPDPFNENLQ